MGIIFSFESMDMLDGKLERIELFRNLGVRVMQLSYNRKSPFAAGGSHRFTRSRPIAASSASRGATGESQPSRHRNSSVPQLASS